MGLDATGYSHVELVPDEEVAAVPKDQLFEHAEENDWIHVFAYANFSASTRGLRNHDVVTERWGTKVIADGWYRPTAETKTAGVSSSYSGHGEFRQRLAEMLGTTPRQVWDAAETVQDMPFYELINFADNEGTIGPDAAADLHQDFLDHREQWEAYLQRSIQLDIRALPEAEVEYFVRKYRAWTDVCAVAAQSGLIDFH